MCNVLQGQQAQDTWKRMRDRSQNPTTNTANKTLRWIVWFKSTINHTCYTLKFVLETLSITLSMGSLEHDHQTSCICHVETSQKLYKNGTYSHYCKYLVVLPALPSTLSPNLHSSPVLPGVIGHRKDGKLCDGAISSAMNTESTI